MDFSDGWNFEDPTQEKKAFEVQGQIRPYVVAYAAASWGPGEGQARCGHSSNVQRALSDLYCKQAENEKYFPHAELPDTSPGQKAGWPEALKDAYQGSVQWVVPGKAATK